MAFKFKLKQLVLYKNPKEFFGVVGGFCLGTVVARHSHDVHPYDVRIVTGRKAGNVYVAKTSWLEAIPTEVNVEEML